MPRTIETLNLDASDSPYKLLDGLWLELRDSGWTLNDDNTSIPVEPSEDLDAISAQWLADTN